MTFLWSQVAKTYIKDGSAAETKRRLVAVLTSESYYSRVTSVMKRRLPVFSPMSNHHKILGRREESNLAVLEIWYQVYNQPQARWEAFTRGQTHCKGMNQSKGLDNWGGDNTSDSRWQSEVWNRSCLPSNTQEELRHLCIFISTGGNLKSFHGLASEYL